MNMNNILFGSFLILGSILIFRMNWNDKPKSEYGRYGRIERLSTVFVFMPLGVILIIFELLKMM